MKFREELLTLPSSGRRDACGRGRGRSIHRGVGCIVGGNVVVDINLNVAGRVNRRMVGCDKLLRIGIPEQ